MRWIVPAAWLLGIGWYFATCVLIGVLAGRWLDGRFGSDKPLFTLAGIFIGLAAALYGGYTALTERVLAPRGPGGTPRGEP